MLILTRSLGESICIGEDVKVVVLRSEKGQVKLGIQAPELVRVYRQEVYDRIQAEKACEVIT